MIKIIRNDADSFWFLNKAGSLCLKIAGINQVYQSNGKTVSIYDSNEVTQVVNVAVDIRYDFPIDNWKPFADIKNGFIWKSTPFIKINNLQCLNLFNGSPESCPKDTLVREVETISLTYYDDKINFYQGEWYLLSEGKIALATHSHSLLVPETNEVICTGGSEAIKRLKPVIKVILKDDKVAYKDLGKGASFLHNDDVYVKGLIDSVNISNVSPGDIYRYDEMKVRLVDLEVVV